ncbi:MAG TPA: hypothetical protein VMN60_09760 [Longimicrobiales bacterium]|nr:hypothetical protein [Longimicrobiales bacterium]
MIRTWSNSAAARGVGVLLALVLVPALVSAQSVDDKYQRARDRGSHFNLASSPTTVLRINQYQCGLSNNGDTCTDVFDSPTGGGGFWPTGSPNQYMFNSGIQTSGIITMGPGCTSANKNTQNRSDCFAWSGDTVGAFFMDAAGTRKHASPLTDIYDSLNPEDLENWPTAGTFPDFPFASAMVEDASLFNDVLLGRKAASQQDTWVMYWDGDPVRTGGRTHPMGILVEQRTLAWNYPTGNESVVYFIYKFTNVTNNPLFQRLSETRYAIELPDAGWRIDSMYVAYMADPDVTHDYNLNYATASFPFNVGMSYDGSFFEPDFVYPPQLFYPPFFTSAPGLIGVKYLKSPINPATGQEVGMTGFSLTTNGGAFPDPSSVQRGWRYHSLSIDPGKGDANCTFPLAEIKQRRSCYLAQVTADVRFYIASGPFSLDPGQSATIALAQYVAATVATPLLTRGANERNPPGFPTLAPGCSGEPIRPIDIGMGYIGPKPGGCPAPGQGIDQRNVNVVPNSLLGRALVAQAIFDNKFLLGFAPETPPFYLVPGSNRVTVVWEPSPTETAGDPFFAAAGNPASDLFDANYRRFDVEGYRIYRGTTPSDMRLIAQFDKSGSVFTDRLCVTDPEHTTGSPCTAVREVPITSPFVQFTSVAPLASGAIFQFGADTALADRVLAGTSRDLTDTGIPFAFIDNDVRNGFQYFYRVTAFDINSVRSGPSSLESAGPTKSVVPQAAASSLSPASFQVGLFGRGDTPLTLGPTPGIDPVTGIFSGPQPPTNAIEVEFQAFAPQLLPPGSYAMRIDSVVPKYYGGAYYLTGPGGLSFVFGAPVQNSFASVLSGSTDVLEVDLPVISVASDPAIRQELSAKGVDTPPLAGSLAGSISISRPHWHSAFSDWAWEVPGFWSIDPPDTDAGGSRWFTGANESTPDPTLGDFKVGAISGYKIFRPVPFAGMAAYQGISSDLFRRYDQAVFIAPRSADMRVYWGAAGIDSVIDVTHNVPVPFSEATRASWGFIADADANGVLNWGDAVSIKGLEGTPNIGTPAARSVPLSRTPVVMGVDVTGNLVSDGNGFALYLAGEPFFFQGAVPANTAWTLRQYHGAVTRSAAGLYAFQPTLRNPSVPGLVVKVNVISPAQIVAGEADLTRVHTVPDPYYATSLFDLSPTSKELQFVNLPAEATIRIYSLSGVLVDVINHNDPAGGGVAKWNLRNRSNQFVASGVYLFHVSTPAGKSHVSKFTVVNAGFGR